MSVRAMEDIRACQPDLVVPLGDFGSGKLIGSPQGLEEAYSLLRLIQAPLHPILGNHDLQRESGPERQIHGTMKAALQSIFGLNGDPGEVKEYETFRLAFVTTDPQQPDTCLQIQECVVSEEQFQRLRDSLSRRRGVPVIVFSHAPPMGCGLRTVPKTHVRATNAYLDQNSQPERWLELAREFPEIVLWFSAHYHLGHDHADSHTVRCGTHFFMTGVHGNCTRDGRRQSRVLDITSDGAAIRTLDHERRLLLDEGQWRLPRPLASLILSKSLRKVAGCSVGEGELVGSLVALPHRRFAMASADGYSWEVRPEMEAVLGAMHVGVQVRALAAARGALWSAWEDYIGVSVPGDPGRFTRRSSVGTPLLCEQIESPVCCMAPRHDDAIWMADAQRQLWTAAVLEGEEGEGQRRIALRPQHRIPGDALMLLGEQDQCWILTTAGELLNWNGSHMHHVPTGGQVLALDGQESRVLALVSDGKQLEMVELSDGIAARRHAVRLEDAMGHSAAGMLDATYPGGVHSAGRTLEPSAHIQITTWGTGECRAIIRWGGHLYDWTETGYWALRWEEEGAQAVAVARAEETGDPDGVVRFAVARQPVSASERPYVELWEKQCQ